MWINSLDTILTIILNVRHIPSPSYPIVLTLSVVMDGRAIGSRRKHSAIIIFILAEYSSVSEGAISGNKPSFSTCSNTSWTDISSSCFLNGGCLDTISLIIKPTLCKKVNWLYLQKNKHHYVTCKHLLFYLALSSTHWIHCTPLTRVRAIVDSHGEEQWSLDGHFHDYLMLEGVVATYSVIWKVVETFSLANASRLDHIAIVEPWQVHNHWSSAPIFR